MANPNAAGVADVHVVGDTRSADMMLDGLAQAFGEQAITYNFLQDRVYPILEARTRQRFASEGDELSGPWAPLGDFSAEQRRRMGVGAHHPINVRTGAMKRHLLEQPPEVYPHTLGGTLYFPRRGGGAKMLEKVTTAQVGSDKGAASSGGGRKTVARPVLGVGVRDMELILVALAVHMKENQLGGGTF
jgi:hypothetical protein